MAGRARQRRWFLALSAFAGLLIGLAFDALDMLVDVTLLGEGPLTANLVRPVEIWVRVAVPAAFLVAGLMYGHLLLTRGDLARASQRYRALAENARDDIFVIAPDMTVSYMNSYAARRFGESDAEAIAGRSIHDLFPSSDAEDVERELRRAFAGEEVYSEREFRFGGVVKWLSTRLVPLPAPGGGIESVLGISRDITGTKREIALGEALSRMGEVVHSRLSVDEILLSVLSEATRAVGVDSGLALTCDEGEWVVHAVSGYPEDVVGTQFGPVQLTSAERASRERTCVVVEDAVADGTLNQETVQRFGIRSLLVVPLTTRHGAVGALMFTEHDEPVCFPPEVVGFAKRVGETVSLAIDNARLYEEKSSVADALQSALLMLPERLPGVEFAHVYHSATEAAKVGGDFYDLFPLDEGRIGVTIGDISGHGIDAAVLTSLVKNGIRVEATQERKPPAKVVETVSRLLFEDSPEDIFATVFFGILDVRDGCLEYCNAGHTTGCIHGAKTIRTLPANSPLTGALPFDGFAQSEERLGGDEILFLYTDGLTEARNDGEFFGEERLLDTLKKAPQGRPDRVVDTVMAEVLAFTGDQLQDDLAIVSMKRAEG